MWGEVLGVEGLQREENGEGQRNLLVVACGDVAELGPVLLVEEVVGHAHLGGVALLVRVVDGERRGGVPNCYAWVPAVAAHVRVLALRRRRGLVRAVVDVGRAGCAAEGPGRDARGLVLGLAEEPDRGVGVGEAHAARVQVAGHLAVAEAGDGVGHAGEGREGRHGRQVALG